LPILELPNLRLHESDSSEFKEDKYSDPDWPPPRYKWPAGQARKAVEALEKALADDRVEPDRLFQLYKALPAPRVPYLDSQRRHVLLRKLALVERKDEESMLRYLSVVDDIKAVGLPLTPHEWNCATAFVGRFVGRITEAEVGASLRMWKEMEHVAGIQANAATFNILFNLATKAGKFELAEMIYEEMRIRGHAFNRYHHVSLIHYHGLRADGDGVRRAYKDLVEAGEIVDTVVLNCMISSLFRAYEPQAAEQVYERMKLLHRRSGMQLPPRDYKKQREVTKSLMRMAEDGRRAPAELTSFKNRSIIAPNIQTYRIMIQSLCVHAGELDKTVMLLDDMRSFGVPLHGSILLALFKGFAIHGGIRYSPWTEDRLGSVWKAVLRAVEDEQDGFYIGKWIVIWALKAYLKCSTKDVALGIWEEAKAKGKLNNDDMDHINNIIRPLMQD
jgi:pentatricopeptide repeat protein